MNSPDSIASLREDYRKASLNESDINSDPLQQFALWFDEARNAQLPEVNAMAVSTINSRGRPSSRILLLKGLENGGFTFYTNYQSDKGQEIEAHPHAALVFLWYALERQVRVEGTISKVSAAESDAYYNQRPVGSRIGAWASPQSQVITREQLEANQEKFALQYADAPPRPPHWGGYRVVPEMIEFWQGRSSRLHDRLRYQRASETSDWTIERLAP